MDRGTRDRLVLCGQAAIDALLLDGNSDSPDNVKRAIDRLVEKATLWEEIVAVIESQRAPCQIPDVRIARKIWEEEND